MSFTGIETPAYADLKPTVRGHIELRLRRSSEFFGSWIVPFVVEDLKTLLVRHGVCRNCAALTCAVQVPQAWQPLAGRVVY